MSVCCSSDNSAICPCGTFTHPGVISNPPGREVIVYRVGDYTAFRHALLQSLPHEIELSHTNGDETTQVWRPGAHDDLAVQMIEWWAYLADLLTFYNERVATQAYLRTADLSESVNRLVRLLGYRPRPGIGATGKLAALANSLKPFTLPKGFQIQSKPGPGKEPQVFELDADTLVGVPVSTAVRMSASTAVGMSVSTAGVVTGSQGTFDVVPIPSTQPTAPDPDNSVLIQGTSSAIKAGDRVLIAPIDNNLTSFAIGKVADVSHEKDPLGRSVTRIRFDLASNLSQIDDVKKFRILQTKQSAHLWPHPASDKFVINDEDKQVDLDSIVRGLNPGDYILFKRPGSNPTPVTQLFVLSNSSEIIWYANPDNLDPSKGDVDPNVAPKDPRDRLPIPIPHTRLSLSSDLSNFIGHRFTTVIWYNWQEVAKLIAPEPQTVGSASQAGTASTSSPSQVTLKRPEGSPPLPDILVNRNIGVIVEDSLGNGANGKINSTSEIKLDDPAPLLFSPLRTYFNLLSVSRGKTVAKEVLGGGNAAIAGQEFVLKNALVTYLQNKDSASGDNYSSTVRVWVDGVEWKEVPSFFGRRRDDQVFITRDDDEGKTHVVFGDGEFGARLPTGVDNVVAMYRYGSGAEVPEAGSLTVVLQPRPGLKSIRNPVPVGGGADPDPPSKLRRFAPLSVLSFGRAVSADDYDAIAAQAPGVVRAKALFGFDAVEQRPRVTVWVGDDDGAVKAAQDALKDAADPNRLPAVLRAKRVSIKLALSITIDPKRNEQRVTDAVRAALLDPDRGLLGVNVVRIGQSIYDSQIYAACLNVPGVSSVRELKFSLSRAIFGTNRPMGPLLIPPRSNLFLKAFFVPDFPRFTRPNVCAEHRHDPTEGGYFFLDDEHLKISQAVAS